MSYEVRFYGQADRLNDGTPRANWSGGQEVLAVAYDVMIPGCYTKTTNNLRLWESKPKSGFDLNSFNGSCFEFHCGGLIDCLSSRKLRGCRCRVQQCFCYHFRLVSQRPYVRLYLTRSSKCHGTDVFVALVSIEMTALSLRSSFFPVGKELRLKQQ